MRSATLAIADDSGNRGVIHRATHCPDPHHVAGHCVEIDRRLVRPGGESPVELAGIDRLALQIDQSHARGGHASIESGRVDRERVRVVGDRKRRVGLVPRCRDGGRKVRPGQGEERVVGRGWGMPPFARLGACPSREE